MPIQVSHYERWLHQRDDAEAGVVTHPDARISQTPALPSTAPWYSAAPHDWIAQAAPQGVIGFTFDRAFAHAPSAPLYNAIVKVRAVRVRFRVRGWLFALTLGWKLLTVGGSAARCMCSMHMHTHRHVHPQACTPTGMYTHVHNTDALPWLGA